MGETQPYVFVSHNHADNARLRPVLVALLDKGIPLWFDLPRQVDLDEARFVGCLRTGQKLQDELDLVLPPAAAFIFFSTAAYWTSEPCLDEYRFADRLKRREKKVRDQEYFLSSLFLQRQDLKPNVVGYLTFVEQSRESWALTDDGKSAIDALCVVLRAKLAAAASEAKGARSGVDDVLLIDRKPQTQGASLALNTLAEPGRFPLLVAYGTDDEEPQSFSGVTLPRRVLGIDRDAPEASGRVRRVLAGVVLAPVGEASRDPLDLDWPAGAGADFDRFKKVLDHELATTHQGVERRANQTVAQAVAEALRQEGCVRLARVRMTAPRRAFSEFEDGLRHWCRYWDTFPLDEARANGLATLIPILEIAFDRSEARRIALKSKRDATTDPDAISHLDKQIDNLRQRWKFAEDMAEFLGQDDKVLAISASCQGVVLIALEKLGSISFDHVGDWIRPDTAIFRKWTETERNDFRDQLRELFDDEPELSMSSWSKKVRSLLRQMSDGVG